MAPLAARFASAEQIAGNAPIKVTAIERELGTLYTVDTLDALVARYPDRRFIWLMGADNLAQFHLWRDWRKIAQAVPIAVATRPGYDDAALKAPAWGWLRRFVQPAAFPELTAWRPPEAGLLLCRLTDLRTALRAAAPTGTKGHLNVNL